MDNVPIHKAQDWMQVNAVTYSMKLNNVNTSQHISNFGAVHGRKGYCVQSLVMEENKFAKFSENQYACPHKRTAFVKVLCSTSTYDGQSEDLSNRDWFFYCLNPIDVVILKKCGEWGLAATNGSGCTCSKVTIYICISLLNLCPFSFSDIPCAYNLMAQNVVLNKILY